MAISGAVLREGVAHTPDGAVYVQHTDGATQANPTFTGQALAADGIVSAPSYSFTSSPTTGIYRYSAANVGVAASGVLKGLWGSTGIAIASDGTFGISSTTAADGTPDIVIARAAENSIRFGGASTTTTSRSEINKAVTAFANAVAKTVFTVTVPNAAHHAVIELEVQGALGAGGAIGAGEAMATNTYKIAIVRTAGVATVATATAAADAVAVAVVGANTVTATAAVTAMSGAVGATQTFDIQMTITRNAGTSDNHTALVYAKLMNANVTGVTIA